MSEEGKGANDKETKKEKDGSGGIKDGPDGIKAGIRQGLGMLSAMKDAIEETLKEAKERGDLTPERAKDVMRTTLEKAQEKAGEAREALDFVKQKEFEALKEAVERLDARVADIEQQLNREEREPAGS